MQVINGHEQSWHSLKQKKVLRDLEKRTTKSISVKSLGLLFID